MNAAQTPEYPFVDSPELQGWDLEELAGNAATTKKTKQQRRKMYYLKTVIYLFAASLAASAAASTWTTSLLLAASAPAFSASMRVASILASSSAVGV